MGGGEVSRHLQWPPRTLTPPAQRTSIPCTQHHEPKPRAPPRAYDEQGDNGCGGQAQRQGLAAPAAGGWAARRRASLEAPPHPPSELRQLTIRTEGTLCWRQVHTSNCRREGTREGTQWRPQGRCWHGGGRWRCRSRQLSLRAALQQLFVLLADVLLHSPS